MEEVLSMEEAISVEEVLKAFRERDVFHGGRFFRKLC